MHPLTGEEEQAYFKAAFAILDRKCRRNLFDVASVILNQGCRPEEIMAAHKCDLDVKASTLTIPGGKSRAARRVLHYT